MSQEIQGVINLIRENNISNIAIISHHSADPDAIASSLALKDLFTKVFPEINIRIYASSISLLAQKLVAEQNETILQKINSQDIENTDAVILCDTNNPVQLGSIDINFAIDKKIPIIIIDHHIVHDFTKKANLAIIQQVPSTAEMITSFYQHLNLSPSPTIATLLLTGILFDTRRFMYVSDNTFRIVDFLRDMGADYKRALSLLQQSISFSERMARLKGIARTVIHSEGEIVFAFSHVSSFESSLARLLCDIGADFSAVIARPSNSELRISMRCNRKFIEKYRIDLATIANKIVEEYNGTGGGHETAAGVNITDLSPFPKDKGKLMKFFREKILEVIKQYRS